MHVHPTFITVYLGQRKIGEKTTSNCVYRDENKTKYQHDCIKLLHNFPNTQDPYNRKYEQVFLFHKSIFIGFYQTDKQANLMDKLSNQTCQNCEFMVN